MTARLHIAAVAAALPLGSGPGVEKVLPPALLEALFGHRNQIYAILDGGRIGGLPERLAALDVPRVCLFSGQMAEEAGEMAPWLVALTPDNPLLYRMLCDVEGDTAAIHGLMRRGPGIFLRSALSLDPLRTHLRRFMRVTDRYDRPFFFRFWEPESTLAYFISIAEHEEKVIRWMCPREGDARLEAICAPTWIDGPALMCITPEGLPERAPAPRGTFNLTSSELEALRHVQWRRDRWALAERLRETFPERAVQVGSSLSAVVDTVVDRVLGHGFSRRDMLFTFCAWALHFGADFLDSDPTGALAQILDQPQSVEERFALLTERMDVLEQDYFALPG